MSTPLPPRSARSPRLAVAALLAAAPTLFAGCNSGLAALFGASQSSDSNSSSVLTSTSVSDGGQSPARVRFTVVDQEGDPALLELWYQPQGGALQPMGALPATGNPASYTTSAAGTPHEVLWDFAAEPDLDPDGLNAGVLVLVRPAGSDAAPSDGANAATVDLGNDPPVVDAVEVPSGEATGIALVELRVSDSSSEPVDLVIEYDVLGDEPDAGWRRTRPATLDETPEVSLPNVLVGADGTDVPYFWDTGADLASVRDEVRLRVTPRDATEVGAAVESAAFLVNNNQSASIQLDEAWMLTLGDFRNTVSIPFTVFDAEGDEVEAVVQWRPQEEPGYPALPTSPEALRALLDDPQARAAHRVLKPAERWLDATLVPLDDARVRFPRLLQELSQLASRGMAGSAVRVLRAPFAFETVSDGWSGGPPGTPVAALADDDPAALLVLARTSPDSWELARVQLADGAAETLAEGAGAPVALARHGARILVGGKSGPDWRLSSVDLAGGARVDASGPGTLRGLAALSGRIALATVDDALVRIGLTDAGPVLVPLVADLDDPRGVALDPWTDAVAWVAERGADRVLRVELPTRLVTPVPAQESGGGAGFPRPGALCFDGRRRLLLAVCDAAGGGELRSLELRRPQESGGGLPAPLVRVETAADADATPAAGPEELLVLVSGSDGALRLAGGVAAAATIVAREGASDVVQLDAPLGLEPGRPWHARIALPVRGVAASPTGVRWGLPWDTSELPQGGDVRLRLAPFDGSSLGTPVESAFSLPLTSVPAVDVLPFEAPGAPDAADLDGDGDLDVVCGAAQETRVLLQGPPGSFTATTDLVAFAGGSASGDPLAVRAVDLDGDGRPDLVAAGADGVQIAWQQPDGSFPSTPELFDAATGEPASALVVADLVAGAAPELATLHLVPFGVSAQVVTWQRTGERSWTPSPPVAVPGLDTYYTAELSALDVDDDGDLDLEVNGEALLEQTSPGVFELSSRKLFVPSDELPWNRWASRPFTSYDLGQDGTLDLLVPHPGFLEFGEGSFFNGVVMPFAAAPDRAPAWFEQAGPGLPAGLPIRSNLKRLERADVDGDGSFEALGFDPLEPDPFIGEPIDVGSDKLVVLRTDAAGEELSKIGLEAPSGGHSSHPLPVVDLVGDGALDLLQCGADGLASAYRLDLGRGLPPALPQPGTELIDGALWTHGWHVVDADLDGDGDLDLVVLDSCFCAVVGEGDVRARVLVLLQQNPRQFTPAVAEPGFLVTYGTEVEAFDVDADGLLDLVLTEARTQGGAGAFLDEGGAVWLRQESPGVFAPGLGSWQSLFDDGSYFDSPTAGVDVGDLDGDGVLDLAALRASTAGGARVSLHLPRPGAAPEVLHLPGLAEPTQLRLSGLVVADVDGNGLLDVVTGNAVDPYADPGSFRPLMVWYQVAELEFTPTVIEDFTGAPAHAVVASDLDGDGRCDLAWTEGKPGSLLRVALQTAPGSFGPPLDVPAVTPVNNIQTGTLEAVDLDRDGLLDLMLLGAVDAPLWLRQERPGEFVARQPFDAGVPGYEGVELAAGLVADLDGDGRLDVLRTGSSMTFSYGLAIHWGGDAP